MNRENNSKSNKLCLFDLDGTLADHTAALRRDMAKIQSPDESFVKFRDENEPLYVSERRKLIRSQKNWWLNLEKMKLGFDIYDLAREIGFQINVLTKGPSSCPNAWTEKVIWCRNHLHGDVKVTISEDKSIVYGRVLVDDYEPYVLGWLTFRPRGLVIMPKNEENSHINHPQVVIYDGSNLNVVESRMKDAFNRE